MEDTDLLARSRTLAKISLAGATVLIVLVLLTPFVVSHAMLPDAVFFLWAIFLLLAALIVGVSLAYIFMTRGMRRVGRPMSSSAATESEGGRAMAAIAPEQVLAFLAGDEKALYRRIVASGGAVLQKDLVGAGGFSGSKLTRLLDRLESKGLVTRERFGMTNRVRLSDAWQRRH